MNGRATRFAGTGICLVCLGSIAWNLLPVNQAQAQDDARVPYPSGYRSWAVVKTNLVGMQSKLFSARGGFHHFYANEKALEGYRTGAFPEGSLIVDEGVYAQESDGIVREGDRRSVETMHKDSRRYGATGGWGFDRFEGGKQVSETTLQARTACYSCHTAKKDRDYVFTVFSQMSGSRYRYAKRQGSSGCNTSSRRAVTAGPAKAESGRSAEGLRTG